VIEQQEISFETIDYQKMAPILFVAQKHHYTVGTESKINAYK